MNKEITGMTDAIVETVAGRETVYSVYARLVKERILYMRGEVNQNVADTIAAQMMYLNSQSTTDPITLYINSPGGVVTDGLVMFDMMRYIKAPVHTVGTGMCASMGAFLLSAGDYRVAMPNCRIMYHKISGGAQGNVQDVEIQLDEMVKINKKLNDFIASFSSGKLSPEQMSDLTKRDKYMTPDEAINYGLLDKVLPYDSNKSKAKTK